MLHLLAEPSTPNLVAILPLTTLLILGITGVLIPNLTALVGHIRAPRAVLAGITLVLATASGVLTPLITVDHVVWKDVVLAIISQIVLAQASHGIQVPLGITGRGGLIMQKVQNGVGAPGAAQPPAA